MLRNYEFTVIFRSDLGDENLNAALRDYEAIITGDDGGAVLKKDEWGTKRFAYPIKKCFRGYYVCYVISTTPKVIKDIEQHIRYDSKVLRYILIAIKGDVPAGSKTKDGNTPVSAASQTEQAKQTHTGETMSESQETTETSKPDARSVEPPNVAEEEASNDSQEQGTREQGE